MILSLDEMILSRDEMILSRDEMILSLDVMTSSYYVNVTNFETNGAPYFLAFNFFLCLGRTHFVPPFTSCKGLRVFLAISCIY